MAQNVGVTSEVLKEFVKAATRVLEGDWVMIGGTVLPLLGISDRVTYDIDMVGPLESSTAQTLKLMEIAEQLGLPVETINQAGAYFYYKLKPPLSALVLLEKSKRCRIFRPGVALFVQLKWGRLSESDLMDCTQMLSQLKSELTKKDQKKLEEQIRGQMEGDGISVERKRRLEQLLKAVLG